MTKGIGRIEIISRLDGEHEITRSVAKQNVGDFYILIRLKTTLEVRRYGCILLSSE